MPVSDILVGDALAVRNQRSPNAINHELFLLLGQVGFGVREAVSLWRHPVRHNIGDQPASVDVFRRLLGEVEALGLR
jgi:hypothetical protein